MNPDKLTVKSGEALNAAIALARQNGNPLVYDTHLLLALLQQDEGIVVPVLQKLGVDVAALRRTSSNAKSSGSRSRATPNRRCRAG